MNIKVAAFTVSEKSSNTFFLYAVLLTKFLKKKLGYKIACRLSGFALGVPHQMALLYKSHTVVDPERIEGFT